MDINQQFGRLPNGYTTPPQEDAGPPQIVANQGSGGIPYTRPVGQQPNGNTFSGHLPLPGIGGAALTLQQENPNALQQFATPNPFDPNGYTGHNPGQQVGLFQGAQGGMSTVGGAIAPNMGQGANPFAPQFNNLQGSLQRIENALVGQGGM